MPRTTRVRICVELDIPEGHAHLSPTMQGLVGAVAKAASHYNPEQWHLYSVSLMDARKADMLGRWDGEGHRVVHVDAETGEVRP